MIRRGPARLLCICPPRVDLVLVLRVVILHVSIIFRISTADVLFDQLGRWGLGRRWRRRWAGGGVQPVEYENDCFPVHNRILGTTVEHYSNLNLSLACLR